MSPIEEHGSPPLHLDAFLALPRVAGLALSADGRRLVTSVATVAPDGKAFTTALWEVDPTSRRAPERLTRSAKGEAHPRFLPGGDLVLTSARPDPDAKADEPGATDPVANLWLLPAGGGEARQLASAPGGIDALAVAREAGTVAVAALVTPGTTTLEEDRARAKARADAGVKALLLEAYPIRQWDHWLGPRQRRLLLVDPAAPAPAAPIRDLTPDPGPDLDEVDFDLTPDGATLVCGWHRQEGRDRVADLVAVDTATGARRSLVAGAASHSQVACSPDGRSAACVRESPGSPDEAASETLWLVELEGPEAGSAGRDLLPGFEHWPHGPVWAPDASAVYFTTDEGGRGPAWRVDVGNGEVARLSREGTFSDLCPSPDGARLYALRSTVASPPEVVAMSTGAVDQEPEPLPTPGGPLALSTNVEETWATAGGGARVHSFLVLPPGASAEEPAPLVVFIHGGPLSSWNAWHWRWNPHLLAGRGYAVLLPDPALSTGYGQAFVQRGWGRWGEEPYTDLMAAVDAAAARPDIDAERTAAMGGSFGGYMANWVAAHTGRFRAIVTHASLWALDQFHGTTDQGSWWEHELGDPYTDPERYTANSPHKAVSAISTPMLVIHGELDHRVPISEALRLWTDLSLHGVEAKFLYFPDENHWVEKPQNARVWYETVLAFLDAHVLGKGWQRPELL
ncbi:MAG: alpha/beta fold hydrolase [Acidimicrobiales bacterium]